MSFAVLKFPALSLNELTICALRFSNQYLIYYNSHKENNNIIFSPFLNRDCTTPLRRRSSLQPLRFIYTERNTVA